MIEKVDTTTESTPEETGDKELALTKQKLNPAVKMQVLAMIARGEKQKTILRILEERHGIKYSGPGLTSLRKNNIDAITQMEGIILDSQASESKQVRDRALRRLNRTLTRADEDERELADLDEAYRTDPSMSLTTYRRRKAGLIKLSVNELLAITKEMYQQDANKKSGGGAGTGANGLPSGTEDESTLSGDPKWVHAIAEAVERGDTIKLSQMIIQKEG